jgi:hypothetical protein
MVSDGGLSAAPAPLPDVVRSLLDLAPLPAWAADVLAPGQPVVYANDRFIQQTGRDNPEVFLPLAPVLSQNAIFASRLSARGRT